MKKLIFISFVAAMLCLGIFALKLQFSESLYSKQNTFSFYVTITDSVISNFPIVDSVSTPEYFYSSGEGPKPIIQSISYKSRAPQKILLDSAVQFAVKKSFAVSIEKPLCPDGLQMYRGVESLEICVKDNTISTAYISVTLSRLL